MNFFVVKLSIFLKRKKKISPNQSKAEECAKKL